ncbi:hypothetical protein TRFO_26202 [Tritrichomonas foetus]|uniref:HEAT repeat family protein n=1 Tax=Tritrichomonas foetus TaxID=1144522 RepID=A0A1J4K3G8_9EUKA|nr:hypothetical protein TRFO_26202 [Tritrichomonas foetus]|eukprot:OHT05919.1 hypothetical protein TRFO_26202 [Tritrichomonas foetus]
MSVDKQIIRLIGAALDPNEATQIQFAANVNAVIAPFSPGVIRDQFLPFIVTWIPKNNKTITLHIATHLIEIVKAAGGLAPVSPLIEALISSEDPKTLDQIASSLSSYQGDPMIDELITRLLLSAFDPVRAFIPQLLPIASSDSSRLRFCQTMVRDKAFLVRFALAEYLPKLSLNDMQVIAQSLIQDPQSRIRAYLPVVCTPIPSFFKDIATPLLSDHDWSVRASLATQVVKAQDHEQAALIATKLIGDGVWQVKLCALQSLTKLLKEESSIKYDQGLTVLSVLSDLIKFPQFSLRTAVIDCFFAIAMHAGGSIPIDKLKPFVDDLVANQPPNVKLHFLNAIAATKKREFAALIETKIGSIVDALSRDDKWRVRLGVVQELHPLADLMPGSNCPAEFATLCLRLTEDEAYPVRIASINHLALQFVSEGTSIPACVLQMKAKDSFRRRQTALQILAEMRKHTSDSSFKDQLLNEMKNFQGDACKNVSLLANKLVEEATN